MVELRDVTKRNGSTVAVDHLRFGVGPGDSILRRTAGKYIPARAGRWVFSVNPDPNALSPWVGYGVLLLYAAVAFAVGAVLLLRRDA
jgi:hypothetical protein